MSYELLHATIITFCEQTGLSLLEMARNKNTVSFKLGRHKKTEGNSVWDEKFVLMFDNIAELNMDTLRAKLDRYEGANA